MSASGWHFFFIIIFEGKLSFSKKKKKKSAFSENSIDGEYIVLNLVSSAILLRNSRTLLYNRESNFHFKHMYEEAGKFIKI